MPKSLNARAWATTLQVQFPCPDMLVVDSDRAGLDDTKFKKCGEACRAS